MAAINTTMRRMRYQRLTLASSVEATMVAIPKYRLPVNKWFEKEHPLVVQMGWLCAAVLFVSVLLMTYGLDLSPGFF